ncbi:MAG: solute:sodium symporter family transporter, partial [Pseudomonadota bacterium]
PEFLRSRYDETVQRMAVVLFMLGYGLVTIPSVLYSGSIAVMNIFNIEAVFGLERFEALVTTVVAIGMIGAVYAVFGGLKAVAVSDTVNGVGLLIVGILVPTLGLIALGQGDFFAGLTTIATEAPEKLNAIGGPTDPTPFGTIFTGMVFANLFYWCANQYVIQRTLAARSLAEGQKGVLFSGFFKVLVPFFMMIPGIIAFHMFGPDLQPFDRAYPRLIEEVFPVWLMGFFLAVLLGAVFSSFNSLLNSAATLFTLDLYTPLVGRDLSDKETVRIAMIASVVIALFSFVVAPMLYFAPEGLWQVIRIFTGFYNIPVVAIVVVGLFTRSVPALGAKIVIVFHVLAYGLLRFVLADVVTLHFLHLYAILFLVEVAIMLGVGALAPLKTPWTFERREQVDMSSWRFAAPTATTLLSAVVFLYVLFSPLGVASGSVGAGFYAAVMGLGLVNVVAWARSLRPGTMKAKTTV